MSQHSRDLHAGVRLGPRTPELGGVPEEGIHEPIGLWLAALIRASSELLDAYVIGGRTGRRDAPGDEAVITIASRLGGPASGEIRCQLDGRLAAAAAEGMWGEPAAGLQRSQIEDAAKELCGQIIGYAAGEVGAYCPGVQFEPPRLCESARPEAPGERTISPHGEDRAVVPTRAGALQWEVRDLVLNGEGPRRPPQHALTVRDRIRALRDTDLPLLQAVRVLGVDDVAEDAFEQLVRAVGSDPALSARILRRVNSASAKPRATRIQTLPQALLYLGTRAAKNIVVTAMLSQSAGSLHSSRLRVINHSVHVALLARHLGPLWGLDPDECYLLGLLHDLGRLVLDRIEPPAPGEAAHLDEAELLQHELRTLGITHPEAGAIVAAAWRFPDAVRLVMTAHHDSEVIAELGLPQDHVRQVQIVGVADHLAERWERGGLSAAVECCDEVAQKLDKRREAVERCLQQAAEQLKEDLLADTP